MMQTAIDKLRVGNTCADVHNAVQAVIDRNGYTAGYRKRTGYSMGISFAPDWGEGNILSLFRGVDVPLDRAVAGSAGDRVVVGLRPEAWHLVAPGTDNGIDLTVDLVEALGSESFIYGVPVGVAATENGVPPQRVTVHSDKRVRPEVGDVVRVVPEPSEVHLFASDTGERLTAAR